MTEINLRKQDEKNYDVLVNDEQAGTLNFDEDQNAWVFNWSDDGTTYEESLEETVEELRDDFQTGLDDDSVTSFGDYKYKK